MLFLLAMYRIVNKSLLNNLGLINKLDLSGNLIYDIEALGELLFLDKLNVKSNKISNNWVLVD